RPTPVSVDVWRTAAYVFFASAGTLSSWVEDEMPGLPSLACGVAPALGVTSLEIPGALSPALLLATTRNLYLVPLVRPGTVAVVAVGGNVGNGVPGPAGDAGVTV